jgi:GT2 family glycosyltransferase
MCDSFVSDSGRGLAAAVNAGIASLPPSVKFVNWLGDDDVVSTDGLANLHAILTSNSDAVLAYGYCQYIDSADSPLFTVRVGRWAETLLRFGPQLISQPAILFRRNVFHQIGELDEKLGWAFDLDLILRLRRQGQFKQVTRIVASYRWHNEALTVGSRRESVDEASSVRLRYLSPMARKLSKLWEPIVKILVIFSASFISKRLLKGR